jgi:hypothetical protein
MNVDGGPTHRLAPLPGRCVDNNVDGVGCSGLMSSAIGSRSTRRVMIDDDDDEEEEDDNDDDDDGDDDDDESRQTRWARATSEGIDKVRLAA